MLSELLGSSNGPTTTRRTTLTTRRRSGGATAAQRVAALATRERAPGLGLLRGLAPRPRRRAHAGAVALHGAPAWKRATPTRGRRDAAPDAAPGRAARRRAEAGRARRRPDFHLSRYVYPSTGKPYWFVSDLGRNLTASADDVDYFRTVRASDTQAPPTSHSAWAAIEGTNTEDALVPQILALPESSCALAARMLSSADRRVARRSTRGSRAGRRGRGGGAAARAAHAPGRAARARRAEADGGAVGRVAEALGAWLSNWVMVLARFFGPSCGASSRHRAPFYAPQPRRRPRRSALAGCSCCAGPAARSSRRRSCATSARSSRGGPAARDARAGCA